MIDTHSSPALFEYEQSGRPPASTGSRSSTTTLRHAPLKCSFTAYLPEGLCTGPPSRRGYRRLVMMGLPNRRS